MNKLSKTVILSVLLESISGARSVWLERTFTTRIIFRFAVRNGMAAKPVQNRCKTQVALGDIEGGPAMDARNLQLTLRLGLR